MRFCNRFLTVLIGVGAASASAATNWVGEVEERFHGKAFADIETSFYARGYIFDRNPFSAQSADLWLDLKPFGKIGGSAWSVSSLTSSGQAASRRNFYNQVDYNFYYKYDLRLYEGWSLANFVAPKWATFPGYRADLDTTCEWNVGQALDNPFVSPYYFFRWAYQGQRWCYWNVGLKRSWKLCDRLTLLTAFFGDFGDGRNFNKLYGVNPNSADGEFSSGLIALNLMIRFDYAVTDWFGLFAFYHQFDVVNSDARDALDSSPAPQARTDMPIFGVGFALKF